MLPHRTTTAVLIVIMHMNMIIVTKGFQRQALYTRNYNTNLFSTKKARDKTTRRVGGTFWEARMDDCWRPTINDVERISWGKPAKQKGTGSRGVPHRLNEEERRLFDMARRKGVLEISGSGWRSQRREAPLLNTYRSLCDARGQVSIVLHKSRNGINDELVVDLSPLRLPTTFDEVAHACLEEVTFCSAAVPAVEIIHQGSSSSSGTEGLGHYPEDESSSLDYADDDNDMKIVTVEDMNAWTTRPIYQLPPYCIIWTLPRTNAKALGKQMVQLFDASEGKYKASSKKPIGISAGKNRRHGGYGIG